MLSSNVQFCSGTRCGYPVLREDNGNIMSWIRNMENTAVASELGSRQLCVYGRNNLGHTTR